VLLSAVGLKNIWPAENFMVGKTGLNHLWKSRLYVVLDVLIDSRSSEDSVPNAEEHSSSGS